MLPLESPDGFQEIAAALLKITDQEPYNPKYAPVKKVLSLLGLGAGLAVTLAAPGAARFFLPLAKSSDEKFREFKEFNYVYLERTLKRLEKEKLVRKKVAGQKTTYRLTKQGQRRLMKYTLENLRIEKPARWNGQWTLVSYDVPESRSFLRDYLRRALKQLGFYPLHKSIYLHAYPCTKQIVTLRDFFGVSANVRIFHVTQIENDRPFRDFFGV